MGADANQEMSRKAGGQQTVQRALRSFLGRIVCPCGACEDPGSGKIVIFLKVHPEAEELQDGRGQDEPLIPRALPVGKTIAVFHGRCSFLAALRSTI